MNTIYKTPGGYEVDKFSHAQYVDYTRSPAAFYWKRLVGYREKAKLAYFAFGHAIQSAVKEGWAKKDFRGQFRLFWESQKNAGLEFPEGKKWEDYLRIGLGLMAVAEKEGLPLENPIFLEKKDAVLTKVDGILYQTIPDVLCEDGQGPSLVDIKTFEYPLGLPQGHVVMDMQLRTQAAAANIFRVGFLVFAKRPTWPELKPKEIVEATTEVFKGEIMAHVYEAIVYTLKQCTRLKLDEIGVDLGMPKGSAQELNRIFQKRRKGSESLTAISDKLLQDLEARRAPVYRIEFTTGQMTKEHALEGLRAELSVVPKIQAGEFPCTCGIRYPNTEALRCPFRGLCLSKRVVNPSEAQLAEWEGVTKVELVRFGSEALEGLDDE